jgi:hypothetical protein
VAIVGTGLVILPLYATCPAAGPVYLFRDAYPNAVPLLTQPHAVYLQPGTELNTTPSGHLTWALLLFWFTFRYCRKRVAAVFAILAALIAISTLGLGEHYVIDLVLAFPFTAAVWSIAGREWKRAVLLLAVTAAWGVALRAGWLLTTPPPVVWALSGITMATAGMRARPRVSTTQEACETPEEAFARG